MKTRVERLESVLHMVLDIGASSMQCSDIADFLKEVHTALGRIMYAANFYVALYSPEDNTIRFAYHVDEYDETPPPDESEVLASPSDSPTAWVIFNGSPLIMTAEETAAQERQIGAPWGVGATPEHWMGYPLLDLHKHAMGAMVIQSYDPAHTYSEENQALFGLIAGFVSNALLSVQGKERLEGAVRERTALLAHEVEERRRSENMQRALYEIAELSFSLDDAHGLYARLHAIVSRLMDAHNFLVARFHADTQDISIQYYVDENDKAPEVDRFPLGAGITSFVVRTAKAQLIGRQRLEELLASGEIKQVLGNSPKRPESWLGVPILVYGQVHGVIIVQSYHEAIRYGEKDLELLAFVADHVAVTLMRIEADREMRATRERLEQQNESLNAAMAELRHAQGELMRQEKLASLGRLVAGIAHEINTPLGICVTATSYLAEQQQSIQRAIAGGALSKSSLLEFLASTDETLRILSANTKRATDLIQGFKQVAVDQTSEAMRQFRLRQYINEILIALGPKLRSRPIVIEVQCDEEIELVSYPGAIAQIITNLVLNSLLHAFPDETQGQIIIKASREGDTLDLQYSDNGIGMDTQSLKKLYEPFYTTKRNRGGSGLGTNVVYNLVTGLLGGTINESSAVGAGLSYHIRFPIKDRIG